MDTVSKKIRSKNMAAIKAKDTKPEMVVRRLLHSSGYRYSLHNKNLPGKPDIFLKSRKAIIFVHGCFWHQHPNCKYAAKPKSNQDFWRPKLQRNVKRDKEHRAKLRKLGYKVITIWECEIKRARKVGCKGLLKKLKRLLDEKSY